MTGAAIHTKKDQRAQTNHVVFLAKTVRNGHSVADTSHASPVEKALL